MRNCERYKKLTHLQQNMNVMIGMEEFSIGGATETAFIIDRILACKLRLIKTNSPEVK